MTPAHPPGLQPERTALAWNRTALGLFANGALLTIVRYRTTRPGVADVLAALALALAAWVGLAARRRGRELRRHPAPAPLAVPRRVVTLGAMVTVFCLLTGVSLLL